MDDSGWDEHYRQTFRRNLLSPGEWLETADGLLEVLNEMAPSVRAAWGRNVEWMESQRKQVPYGRSLPPDEVFGVYLMIGGFAVENILKAAMVARRHTEFAGLFDKDGKLPAPLKSHALFDLAKSLSLELTDTDESMLRRMEFAIAWYGRYPVPSRFGVLSGQSFSDGKKYNLRMHAESDVSEVPTLISRIRAQLAA
jgi:hypothetical protein